jgi:uncharacterized protein (TIRG00374 family)
MRGSLRKILLLAVALVVIGGLLYRSRDAIRLEDFSWASLGEALRGANWWLLLLSLLTIYLCYFIRAMRWVRFSRYMGRLGVWGVFRSTLIGFAVLFLLGRPADPIRPILIARKERIPVSSSFGIYVLERLFDTGATIIIAGITLLFFPRGTMPVWARTTGLTLLLLLSIAIGSLVYFRLHGAKAVERRLESWRGHHGWRARVAGLFTGFSEGLQSIRTFSDLAAAVGYSALHWGLVVCAYLSICWSFGGKLAEIRPTGAMLVLAFTMVGSTVQLPGVGGGAQAASFVAFKSILGIEKEPALVAAVVIWLITFAGCTLAGVPLLVREGWSMGELRRMAQAEAAAEADGGHLSAPPEPHR